MRPRQLIALAGVAVFLWATLVLAAIGGKTVWRNWTDPQLPRVVLVPDDT